MRLESAIPGGEPLETLVVIGAVRVLIACMHTSVNLSSNF